MSLVDKVVAPLLGDEQCFIKEEESLLVAHTVHTKRALQNELPVDGQVRPLPVDEQRLDLLQQRSPNPYGQTARDHAGDRASPQEAPVDPVTTGFPRRPPPLNSLQESDHIPSPKPCIHPYMSL